MASLYEIEEQILNCVDLETVLIRKSAQLEAIKNMALQKEVLDGDAVLAICGVMKESE